MKIVVFLALLGVQVASAGWLDNGVDSDHPFLLDSPIGDVDESIAGQDDKRPEFNNGGYHTSGVIRLPYAEIHEPFEAWYDSFNSRSRIDYYNGTMMTYQLGAKALKGYDNGTMRKVIWTTLGSIDAPVRGCFEANGSKDNPTGAQSIFPNITFFQQVKTDDEVNGIKCELWQNVTTFGKKINTYNFWVSKKKSRSDPYFPVRYEMKGFNSLLGSHYDHYIIDYDNFDSNNPSGDVFKVDAGLTCRGFPGPGRDFNPIGDILSDAGVSEGFEDFKRTHGKDYETDEEHARREAHYRHNLRFIKSHNRKNLGFRLAPNHLMDFSKNEMKILRGRKPTKGYNGGQPYNYNKEDLKTVPGFWDWRYLGAVTPVKDQSICGSCWTFGTTGTLEGAYFLKTGELVKLSQQALIDCSWQFDNNGCDGGEDFRAYEWMQREGGIPTAESYGPYMGADGKCHASDKGVQKVGQLFGYVNVTSGDKDALKLAVFQQGPISVAIDASHRTFSFYANGIYYDPECKNGSDDLDHAVLVVGYGELYGEQYWLVKNSWSTYWGNDGYILMSMKDNNCGVATEPTFVIM